MHTPNRSAGFNAVVVALGLSGLMMPPRATADQGDSAAKAERTPTSTATLDPLSKVGEDTTSPAEATKLPDRVASLAKDRGFNPEDVKLEGGQWVACVGGACHIIGKSLPDEIKTWQEQRSMSGLRVGDLLEITGHAKVSQHVVDRGETYGIPGLGEFKAQPDGSKTFIPNPAFLGTVVKIKSAPVPAKSTSGLQHRPYEQDLLSSFEELLRSDPDKTFVLVISVPSLCGPCRQYIHDIEAVASSYPSAIKREFFVIDFPSFESARQQMGNIKAFPATLILPPQRADESRVDGDRSSGPFLDRLRGPGFQLHGRLNERQLEREIVKAQQILSAASDGNGWQGIKWTTPE